jgi:MOSC domain-containing protein YiiM
VNAGLAGRVISVRVGGVRTHGRPDWDKAAARTWTSAYVKDEVAGPSHVGIAGLAGDQQHDRRVHGGPEMAVLMYANENHAFWRTLAGLEGMGPGGFGENLTVNGLVETAVCIGDVLQVGGARLQVASPRGPCANIARRWNAQWLLDRVRRERRTGWYLRVQEEGVVAIGDEIQLLERPHPGWTIDRLLALRYVTPRSEPELAEAAALPALTMEWRQRYAKLPALD